MWNIAVLSLAAMAFLSTSTVALAADPTQSDFDACNQMAQSGAQSKVSPSASPQTTPDPKTPPSASAPQAAPSDKTAAEARVENQANQLRGIADASKDDPSYQRAYRDCMKGRGF
jgi:hypothetical protein